MIGLVHKYNVPGPRYTSYPTALQLTDSFDQGLIEENCSERRSGPRQISLYFHIPFCFSLCWYCGCTKIITRNQDRGDIYLDYLEKEMLLLKETLHPESAVHQIHFGGGTPTFLSPEQLRKLGNLIHSYFTIHQNAEFSVEIDPRRVGEDHILALKEIGCNRASLGVQDTNDDVQEAIHRIQPFEQTTIVADLLRKHGIKHINIDLIYGLPKQTLSSFRKSIDDVLSLDPDRFAIYSYAHIPSVMVSQKLLNESDLPSTEEKLGLLVFAVNYLTSTGYNYIGMDHFAKEGDELSIALREGTLHRNFQGYSTRAELEMIGLGMSSISQNENLYTQNEKDLNIYYEQLDSGKLPVKKVLELSEEDKIRKKVIMQIMCRGEINYDSFLDETGLIFRDKFHDELGRLKEPETDGLLHLMNNGFRITSTGRLFLRNIAMVFDEYLTQKHHKTAYSKTV
jgi:oxygen-independent coproporphyrinogen III oxidase